MLTLFWVLAAAVLVWAVLKLARSGSGRSDGDSGMYYSDGGSSSTGADCSDAGSDGGSDGGSCDGGSDGGGGD